MLHWTIEPITLDLKYTWRISRNASDQKTNLIVTVGDGKQKGMGEAAPNIRYNESSEQGIKDFQKFVAGIPENIENAGQLRDVINQSGIFLSLAFAIESAWLDFQTKKSGKTLFEMHSLPSPGLVKTSYTIPIMETGLMKEFFVSNRLSRFPYIKLKVNAENASESLKHLLTFCDNPVMIDANESFTDVEQCIYWLEKLNKRQIIFIEQPLPSEMKDESQYLKKHSPFPLFADEAVTDSADFRELKKSFDGINMKLMKAGGILNGINLLKEARANQMKTMIGCMVETTLGISAAMHLCGLTDYADLDSFMLIKNEPYRLVAEKDGELELQK